jgi:hypothetical protein
MIAKVAKRFGLNYLWGLFMFTLGVIGGAAMVGVVAGLFGATVCGAVTH